jgi:hypothetical protein
VGAETLMATFFCATRSMLARFAQQIAGRRSSRTREAAAPTSEIGRSAVTGFVLASVHWVVAMSKDEPNN